MYAKYFVLFAILFTGYFLRKIGFLDDAMNHGLNKFIVYFAYPCMIIHKPGHSGNKREAGSELSADAGFNPYRLFYLRWSNVSLQ